MKILISFILIIFSLSSFAREIRNFTMLDTDPDNKTCAVRLVIPDNVTWSYNTTILNNCKSGFKFSFRIVSNNPKMFESNNIFMHDNILKHCDYDKQIIMKYADKNDRFVFLNCIFKK